MAFAKLRRAHFPFTATTRLDPRSLLQLFSYTNKPNSPFSTPVSTKTHYLNSNSSLSSDDSRTVNDLISIFTKKPPFIPQSQELRDFYGPKLTTQIVESVLKRLKSWKVAILFFNWASSQYNYRHNCYTYNAMATVLAHARQNDSMRVLAKEMVNSQCWMTPGALGFFIRCLGDLAMVEESNFVFDQVKKSGLCVPNAYSYNCLLEAISKSASAEMIEMRLDEMRGFGWEYDKYTLTPVLRCYCKAGKFDKALLVFNQMQERGWVDEHAFSILVVSFSKWGEVDKTFELIEKMEDHKISLNEKTFFVLIHGFVREGSVDNALQLLDKMQKLGFSPDISLYDVLIGGFCKNKEFEKALELYSRMREMGIHPDVKILTTLILSLPGEKEMCQVLEVEQENLDKEALVSVYNSVLNVLVNNNKVGKAYCFLQMMMGDESGGVFQTEDPFIVPKLVQPNAMSFQIVIDGFCQTGKLDLALDLFHSMDSIGCKRSVFLYNNLIESLNKSNRLEECFVLFSDMKKSEIQPTQFTYNSIFGCLCRREDTEGALNMLGEMRLYGHEPWIKYYTLLVKQLCKHGRAVEAHDFLDGMVKKGFHPDIIAYTAVMEGFIKIKELNRALELFRYICGCGHCPDVVAYNIIIDGLCKGGKVLEAQDVFVEMREKGLVPSVVTHNSIIDGWCKIGDIDNALAYLSKMIEENEEPNVFTYTTVIDGLCNAGRPDDALQLWTEMEGKGCFPNIVAFMAFIYGLCKCKRPDDAFLYLQRMEENQMKPDAYVYVALIEALTSNSNLTLAFDVLKKMLCNGNLPKSFDKNHVILKDAIVKMSEDARISTDLKNLVADLTIGFSSSEN